ncbi:hypothetical protein [Nocardia sp. NPDC024068]|uniref:hypothetical protein n=1 Tax=Nocardia sp. NPDC024068 TaxID=3157197 RepID=UPI0033E5BA40
MAAINFARIMGAATACYGLAVAARPSVLLAPCGWDDSDPGRRALARTTAFRDVASGLGMLVAPTAPALRIAVAGRVLSDFSDAAVLGTTLRGRPQRGKAVAVAAGWGLLCAVAGVAATRAK